MIKPPTEVLQQAKHSVVYLYRQVGLCIGKGNLLLKLHYSTGLFVKSLAHILPGYKSYSG